MGLNRLLLGARTLDWAGVFKASILHTLVSVDKFPGQVLLALDTLDVEALSHAVWVERCLASWTLDCLFVKVHNILADTDRLEFGEELPR